MKVRIGMLALGLVALGCENPPDIVPVAPPGVEVKRVLPLTEDQGAQALGETSRLAGADAAPAQPVFSTQVSPPTKPGKTLKTLTGIVYSTVKPGSGVEALPGKLVKVHYVGTHTDGRKFDSSRDRDEPYQFLLGAGKVIRGWDEGVSGMLVGERRTLTIPAELAYGPTGSPPAIMPNETLQFEVELLGVMEPAKDLTQAPRDLSEPPK
ncbi:MAG TPA: FKBP-type peptidyl-prolyl cis-trans isomerase [Isosphaeraceae bacterium]|jgi:FKBP-type peptidyl-prolyl cis-trans isomerase FkpA|nr:FKBP-type peptidyl-prolyl cis-trans isomerase [Isosphaeraceae bacterium]